MPEPALLPPARLTRGQILRAARAWLTGTFTGRAVASGAVIKFAAFLLTAALGPSRAIDAFDSIGDIALVAAALVLGYRVYLDAKRRLLWRVRRKLILSYVFIGVVPALLIVSFFLLAGTLLFLNISSFMLRSRFESLVEETRFLAQSAAQEVPYARGPEELASALARRHKAAAARYSLVSYALMPATRHCALNATTKLPRAITVGPWSHVDPPKEVPEWVACTGVASLITSGTRVLLRAVVWPEGVQAALIVDVPFDEAMMRALHDEMGITVGSISSANPIGTGELAARNQEQPDSQRSYRLGPASADIPPEPFGWVAPVEYVEWSNGRQGLLTVGFGMGPAAVYRYLSGPSSGRLGGLTFNQLLLFLLAVIGSMFLIIQGVAFLMGFSLARSITGSVHALFVGTERLRRGDFAHKIAIRSRDQLGELAGSFNSMAASIEDLLEQKAEKERLEEELRIARRIQMSLLPSGSLSMRGVTLTGHCVPAREVGGDYYDFLPLEQERMGILIADVAGKGTSAALYMAELKGLVLSLSQLHASPRQLLIDANRIISKHLDTRSFITMTYAVVDIPRRTMTVARAGHCPLVFVPGPHASCRDAQSLQPDGMVLGLALDTGDMFSRVLEEMTLPIDHGDLFLLYTDGISEAMNLEGDYFGDTRLADLARQHADLGPSELSERILGEVRRFAGSAAQHDDMTMVLVKIENL